LVLGSNIAGVTVVSNASITTEVQNVSAAASWRSQCRRPQSRLATVSVGSTSTVKVITVTNNMTTAFHQQRSGERGIHLDHGRKLPAAPTFPPTAFVLWSAVQPDCDGSLSGVLTLRLRCRIIAAGSDSDRYRPIAPGASRDQANEGPPLSGGPFLFSTTHCGSRLMCSHNFGGGFIGLLIFLW